MVRCPVYGLSLNPNEEAARSTMWADGMADEANPLIKSMDVTQPFADRLEWLSAL